MKTGTKSRRKRLTQAERRRSLLETAEHLFATHGFKGTTTRRIADAAGVTEAVIFQHFPDKATLYAAVLEKSNLALWTDEWVTALESRLDAGDEIGFVRLLYSHIVAQCERYPSFARLALYSALEPHPVTRRVQNSTGPRFQKVLTKFILVGQRAGRYGPGAIGMMIRALVALPHYHVLQQQLFRNPWQKCETADLLETGVEIALAGLRRAKWTAPERGDRGGTTA